MHYIYIISTVLSRYLYIYFDEFNTLAALKTYKYETLNENKEKIFLQLIAFADMMISK
jgi:hypothetical protein